MRRSNAPNGLTYFTGPTSSYLLEIKGRTKEAQPKALQKCYNDSACIVDEDVVSWFQEQQFEHEPSQVKEYPTKGPVACLNVQAFIMDKDKVATTCSSAFDLPEMSKEQLNDAPRAQNLLLTMNDYWLCLLNWHGKSLITLFITGNGLCS